MSAPPASARWKVLLPLLLATVAITGWLEMSGGDEVDEVASAVVRPARTEPRPDAGNAAPSGSGVAADRDLRIELAARTAGTQGAPDPFFTIDWNPPPPKVAQTAVAQEPPPKPVPPPIPYTYFGMSIQDGRTVVFVQRQERTFVLAAGEVVENRYRVEEIRPTEVVLTYLPLNERQVMTIGPARP